MFDKTTAVFASIFFTFSSVVIFHTRSSWNPNPMPLIIILLLWSFYEAYVKKKMKFLILSWILWGISLQLHYMTLLLAPFLFVVWVLIIIENKDRKSFFTSWFLGLLGFIILALPLIIFDLRHNFLNTKGMCF